MGVRRVREWRERADSAAAGIGLTFWDYIAQKEGQKEVSVGL